MHSFSRLGMVVFLGLAFVFIVGIIACNDPVGSSDNGTGTIELYSYSEVFDNFFDHPSEIEGSGRRLYSLVNVSPAIHGRVLLETNASGFLKLENVPDDTYTFSPLYAPSDFAKTINVADGQTTEVLLPTPLTGIYMYIFNIDSTDPPFDQLDVRKALAVSINRSDLISTLNNDDTLDLSEDLSYTDTIRPARSFIPFDSTLTENWTHATLSEDSDVAESLLSNATEFDFVLLYNSDGSNAGFHDNVANHVIAQWESLSKVGSGTQSTTDFGSYLDQIGSNSADMWVGWWYLNSNNLHQYFELLFAGDLFMNITDTAFVESLENARSALDEQDIETYEQSIISANDRLLEIMPAVPLLRFE